MASVVDSQATQQDLQPAYPPEGRTDFHHTGPDTLAGRYMRTFWQPVYVAADLPAGRAKPIRIMSEELTLYRGESGTPHVVAFRCAHRGTQLSTGWVEGDDLRCFYHGWKYDGSGQCIEQPAEPEPFCNRIRIRSYPTVEYIGLVFCYLGEGEAPPLRRFPQLEDDGYLDVTGDFVWPCNYFNRLENDPVHVAFVHKVGRQADAGVHGIPTVACEETEYGMMEHSIRPDGRKSTSYRIMPNISYFPAPPVDKEAGWRDNMSWRIPVDDTHYTRFSVTLVRLTGDARERYAERRAARAAAVKHQIPPAHFAEAVLRGELRIEDIPRETWDQTNIVQIQDYVALVGQGAIADHSNERLGHSDVSVILFRNLWQRELRALAEGRPISEWRLSKPIVPEIGSVGDGAAFGGG